MRIIDIYHELEPIINQIPPDFGGGSSIAKTTLMAYIAIKNNLKNYVEIGVYKGRSFFPMARAMQIIGGQAFGIDPFNKEDAFESDIADNLKPSLEYFLETSDFEQIYKDVLNLQETLHMINCTEIIRKTSKDAAEYFKAKPSKIDMLHIDGNHDTIHVLEDIQLYLPLMSDNGYIVVDDINWDSVKPAFNALLRKNVKIKFITETFCVLQLCEKSKAKLDYYFGDEKFYEVLYSFINKLSNKTAPLYDTDQTKISVILTSYNHEDFIEQALIGILAQAGPFKLELIVADDASKDQTRKIIDCYLELVEDDETFSVIKLDSHQNLGLEKNYKRAFKACSGKYIAICEGDDYWTSPQKLSIQLAYMKQNPQCSFCFNNFYFLWQSSNLVEPFSDQLNVLDWEFSTRGLIQNNYIGNFSCCFYDSLYIAQIPDSFYDLFYADWFFNVLYSTFGQIGQVKEFLSVYRKHQNGLWSGRSPMHAARVLEKEIQIFNKLLNFEWDSAFNFFLSMLRKSELIDVSVDLLIIDDFFPDEHSSFRFEEYTSYLHEFQSSYITVTDGPRFGANTFFDFEELLSKFKRNYPDYANKVSTFDWNENFFAKCLYLVFLNNAYQFIDYIEKIEAPFVFTLYPGGGFQLYDESSDKKLVRILSSPCFRKVIVTQEVTYDYLVQNSYCDPENILTVFGVPLPSINLTEINFQKKNFGINKPTLDISFVAHKYTELGLQKGYDVFIETARRLRCLHDNIYFHVVGGFDEKVIDVSDFEDRIFFYGFQSSDWFGKFYENIDIIISPNVPSAEFKGSFDGFPTTACINASLHKTAMFCTDLLSSNKGYFLDNKEILIIPRDPAKIVDLVEHYYNNPQELIDLAENGRNKALDLYSYEKQLLPRIELIKSVINESQEYLSQTPSMERNLHVSQDSVEVPNNTTRTSLLSRAKYYLNVRKYTNLLKHSGFFDLEYYIKSNPDIVAAYSNPYHHYLRFGGFEGRNPSEYFDSNWYLSENSDVRSSGINPLIHYLLYGQFEGRKPKQSTGEKRGFNAAIS